MEDVYFENSTFVATISWSGRVTGSGPVYDAVYKILNCCLGMCSESCSTLQIICHLMRDDQLTCTLKSINN